MFSQDGMPVIISGRVFIISLSLIYFQDTLLHGNCVFKASKTRCLKPFCFVLNSTIVILLILQKGTEPRVLIFSYSNSPILLKLRGDAEFINVNTKS